MDKYVLTVCGKPLAGKTTIMVALSKWLEENRASQTTVEKINGPGKAVGYVMRITTGQSEMKFFWFRGESNEPNLARQWTLREGQAVIYVFSTFQRAQPEHYREHQDIAANLDKLPQKIPWLHVLNIRDNFPREPIIYPEELTNSMIEINAKSGYGIDVLWSEILRIVASSTSDS